MAHVICHDGKIHGVFALTKGPNSSYKNHRGWHMVK